MIQSMLTTIRREFRVMGTDAQIIIVTEDVHEGEDDLGHAEEDLRETERALSRFREDSDLSRLNREGRSLADERLLTAVRATARAHALSDGLLDPRVIDSLEDLGYRDALPDGVVKRAGEPSPLRPVDMETWIDERTGEITLPPGVRLDLAGVGKALGIGWTALRLAGRHAGILVDVGGDLVALGHDENGEPWRVSVNHGGNVGELAGSPLAVATSTTMRRAWKADGERVHHLIDPRTGEPSRGRFAYATVAAPTIIEADLAAKLLILEGREALRRFGGELQAVVTDRDSSTELLAAPEQAATRSEDGATG